MLKKQALCYGLPLSIKLFSARNLSEYLKKDPRFPPMSPSTLYLTLKAMGFKWVRQKGSRDVLLLDRKDLVRWRDRYHRRRTEFDEQGRIIVYQDESYIHTSKIIRRGF